MVLGYRLTAFCATFASKCTCGLFLTCVHPGTTCSLFKRVYPYQLEQVPVMCLGFIFDFMSSDMCQACEWNSQQLTECITHVLLLWLTARGYRLTPLFSVLFWWHELPLFLNEEILRVPDAHLILLLISLPKCLGTLEGQRWSLKLQHFLDGVFHRAVAIEGSCCSLYNAMESTLLNHSGTAFKSYYSWGVSLLSP